jgi:hypothetical protein
MCDHILKQLPISPLFTKVNWIWLTPDHNGPYSILVRESAVDAWGGRRMRRSLIIQNERTCGKAIGVRFLPITQVTRPKKWDSCLSFSWDFSALLSAWKPNNGEILYSTSCMGLGNARAQREIRSSGSDHSDQPFHRQRPWVCRFSSNGYLENRARILFEQ